MTLIVFVLATPFSYADEICDYISNVDGSGQWGDDENWLCFDGSDYVDCDSETLNGQSCKGNAPDAGDKATILAGDVIYIEGCVEEIDTLIIQDDASTPGELELRSGASASSLTIYVGLTMETDTSPGTITFTDGSSTTEPGELLIDGDNITAAGDITAQAGTAGATITVDGSGFEIAGNLSVTAGALAVDGDVSLDTGSATSVTGGSLTMTGTVTLNSTGTISVTGGSVTFDGTFENDGSFSLEGTAEANVEFKGSGGIACDSAGTWSISSTHSASTFKVTTASTVANESGSFTLSAATVDVDADFKFDGDFTWQGGTSMIDVAAGKTFLAADTDLPPCP